MDEYGLTEMEQHSGMQSYNHALFDNMMYFMDMSWEIRFPDTMVTIIADRTYPERDGHVYAYGAFLEMWTEECVVPEERAAVLQELASGRLHALTEETTFDATLIEMDEPMQFRFVLTPAFDKNGRLYCVYLGARNMAEESKRIATEETARLRMDNTKLQQMIARETQYRLSLLSDALMVLTVNLTTNTIGNEFYQMLDGNEYPVLSALGLSAPCSFDLFCEHWNDQSLPDISRKSFLRLFSRKSLLDAWSHGEKRAEAEFEATLVNGSSAILRCVAVLYEEPGSEEILAMLIARDVTQQRQEEQRQRDLIRQTNETLRAALDAANKATAARTEFLSRISHNIRTPMNAIAGMSAIAGSHVADADRTTDYLQKITSQSRHLLALLNEVSDMSDFEAGKIVLKNEPMSLRELYMEISDRWLPQIAAKHQKAEMHVTELTHEQVLGDRVRITQVLDHLLRNAVHFTPEGGTISLTLSEHPDTNTGESCFIFIVRDTGIGIPQERLNTLFDPYSATDWDEEFDAAGLGLPISLSIVQKMNGDITVASEPGRGSSFNVTLCLKPLENEDSTPDTRLQGRPVLVVENDELSAAAAKTLLARIGTGADVVNSGQAAIALMQAYSDSAKGNLFAVLIDAAIPDCLTTVQSIRSIFGDSLPLLLSSVQDEEQLSPALREAATAVIRQPLFLSDLRKVLSAVADEEIVPMPQQEDLSDETFEGKRALLVEDNYLNAEIATELLGVLGLEVEHVSNGREALLRIASCTEQEFDIVLMDLVMPLMNGIEATQALRSMDRPWAKTLPIAAMSMNQNPEDISKALDAGCNEFIAKPLSESKLRAALHRLIGCVVDS